MASPGIVDRNPLGVAPRRVPHRIRLVGQPLRILQVQPLDLALGNVDADRAKQRRQARQRRLALMIQHLDHAPEAAAEMALGIGRERSQHRPPVRRQPAGAAIFEKNRLEHNVVGELALPPLENRSLRKLRRVDLQVDGLPPVCDRPLAAAPSHAAIARAAVLAAARALVHAARLQPRALRHLLQDRDLVPQIPD